MADPKKNPAPVGHALYCEGDIAIAFEAGRTAGEYAARGEYMDVHCTDAALEGLHQLHGLLREHKDIPQPVGAPAVDPIDCGASIVALCEEHDAQPVAAKGEAGLDPASIALLFQLAMLLKDLYFKWRF